jgi:hypothetical protein
MVENMKALEMAGISAEFGSHSSQTHCKSHRGIPKCVEEPERYRGIVPMKILRRPKGFDHEERSVSVFEEPTKLTIARVEAADERFSAFCDKRIEGGPSSRQGFDRMALGQEVFGQFGTDPAGRANHGNTHGSSPEVV